MLNLRVHLRHENVLKRKRLPLFFFFFLCTDDSIARSPLGSVKMTKNGKDNGIIF